MGIHDIEAVPLRQPNEIQMRVLYEPNQINLLELRDTSNATPLLGYQPGSLFVSRMELVSPCEPDLLVDVTLTEVSYSDYPPADWHPMLDRIVTQGGRQLSGNSR